MKLKSRLSLMLQLLAPQHALSRVIGKLAAAKCLPTLTRLLIKLFIWRFKVNMDEALYSELSHYKNFNDFFTRRLEPGARPIAEDTGSIVFPADGQLGRYGKLNNKELLQAKGHTYNLNELLAGKSEWADTFANGHYLTVYLSPKDYHRVHMPIAGKLTDMLFVPGKLFSVNALTTTNLPNLYAKNERVICLFETELGPVAVILVGAMLVASVVTPWAGVVCPGGRSPIHTEYPEAKKLDFQKGDEMGHFQFGSTAIVLFPEKTLKWESGLRVNDPVKMGQAMAHKINT